MADDQKIQFTTGDQQPLDFQSTEGAFGTPAQPAQQVAPDMPVQDPQTATRPSFAASTEGDDSSVTPTQDAGIERSPLEARAEELGVPALVRVPKDVDREVVRMITEDVARTYNMAAFGRDEKALRVATTDPHNVEMRNILRFVAQKEHLGVEIFLTSDDVLGELYKNYKSAEAAVTNVMEAFSSTREEQEARKKEREKKKGEQKEVYQDTPVAKLVQVIINHALEGAASDIHIEPIDNQYRVRFRLDGALHSSLTFPLDVGRAVVARIKILSSLKIDEKRKPQDGRFRIDDKGNAVDFRVSTLPVVDGEKVVMRVLEKDRQSFDLGELGLMGSNYDTFMQRIRDPHGMILMTGPTGSGKSTTLSALLKILNGEVRNIVTLEDPVEYFIPGINQSQVKPEIGYTFASGLRSILRQDPNVIMVGEIRDEETAELAIHAALTGHLLFSTVHTNNAIGAVARLVDIGIEPFLLASSLTVVAAQRLTRRLCQHCKEPDENIAPVMLSHIEKLIATIPDEEKKKYKIDPSAPLTFYKSSGCDECGNAGTKGRVAIYEVIDITNDIQEIIADKGGALATLERHLEQQNVITMKKDGLLKALLGLVSLQEIERVTEGSLTIGGNIDEA